MAESSACMPDAQLRITVHAGTLSPQPRRSDTTRPMLASSAEGIAAPTMTSSNTGAGTGMGSAQNKTLTVTGSLLAAAFTDAAAGAYTGNITVSVTP